MKKYLFAFTITLFLQNTLLAQSIDPVSIFRTVTVVTAGGEENISLDKDILNLNVVDLLTKDETGFYTFKPYTFMGAQDIIICVTGKNQIKEIDLKYEAKTDFEKTVASYTQILGEPSSKQQYVSDSGTQSETVIWEDTKTRFLLAKRVQKLHGADVLSFLQDKENANKK